MNTLSTVSRQVTLADSIAAYRESINRFTESKKQLFDAMRNNGNIYFEKLNKQQREKLHDLELEINESAYHVHFNVEAYQLTDGDSDFEVNILEVCKCHIKESEYGNPLAKIHVDELDQIKGEVYKFWEKNMPDNFYEDLGENTDCPINDDTKSY